MEPRERKFRGMDANGVMRYGRLSQDKKDSTVYYEEYSQRICWDCSNIPVSNKSLGQYIGIKNKTGEIYQGDIVKDERGKTYEVFAVPGGVAINPFGGRNDNNFWNGLSDMQAGSWIEQTETIGNIHQHPELLKETP